MTSIPILALGADWVGVVLSHGIAHSPTLAGTVVDRMNLLTGIILLCCGLYLRFVTLYRVPAIYEYAYLLAGATFFVSGMFYVGNPDLHVLAIRAVRQVSVILLAYTMFHHLVITTNIDPPSKRIPEVIHELRGK